MPSSIYLQNNLWEENEIRLFKLTSGSDEFGVVLTDDYVAHIKARVIDPNVHRTIGMSYFHNAVFDIETIQKCSEPYPTPHTHIHPYGFCQRGCRNIFFK